MWNLFNTTGIQKQVFQSWTDLIKRGDNCELASNTNVIDVKTVTNRILKVFLLDVFCNILSWTVCILHVAVGKRWGPWHKLWLTGECKVATFDPSHYFLFLCFREFLSLKTRQNFTGFNFINSLTFIYIQQSFKLLPWLWAWFCLSRRFCTDTDRHRGRVTAPPGGQDHQLQLYDWKAAKLQISVCFTEVHKFDFTKWL